MHLGNTDTDMRTKCAMLVCDLRNATRWLRATSFDGIDAKHLPITEAGAVALRAEGATEYGPFLTIDFDDRGPVTFRMGVVVEDKSIFQPWDVNSGS